MEEVVVDSTLRRITKGAGIFLFGTVFSLFFGLITRIVVIRYISKPEYGVLTLALTIFSIVQVVASFGIPMAMVRQASYYSGKEDEEKVKAIMKLALFLVITLSIIWSLLLCFFSGILAKIFKMPQLKWVLCFISFSMPFVLLNDYLISIYQSLENVKAKVTFSDFLLNFLRFLIIILIINIELSFYGVILAYTLAPIAVFIIFFMHFLKTGTFKKIKYKTTKCLKYTKELISFSAPLALQSILGLIITWTDIIMLGYMLTAKDVAIYGAAKPIANILTTVLNAATFLYFPIVSQLFGRGLIAEIRRTYAIITKWMTSVTLPFFLIVFLFPKSVIYVLFGSRYLDASAVLSILALAFFIHVAFGPNGLTLITFGENNFVTVVTALAAIMNIFLNAVLIPQLGVIGAAIATLVTYSLSNIMYGVKLTVKYGIHPFTKNYLKPIVIFTPTIIIVCKCFSSRIEIINLVLLFIFIAIIYFVSVVTTKSFDREDIMLLNTIEQRSGINLKFLKTIIKKFL